MKLPLRLSLGTALATTLVAGSLLAASASAQTPPRTPPLGPGRWAQTGAVSPHGVMMADGDEPEAVANALGISTQELLDARQAGKSIADLTAERGVALETVINAATDAHADDLNALVDSGRLTRDQADTMLAFMRTRMESGFAVAATGPFGRMWSPMPGDQAPGPMRPGAGNPPFTPGQGRGPRN